MANRISEKKSMNYELFDKLNENNKDEIINRIREKFDQENGITFQPNLEENEYLKNVDGNFFERNEKWINKRNNFIEEEKMKQNENIKNYCGNKDYTKEEKTEIINNIINRLYYNQNNDEENE